MPWYDNQKNCWRGVVRPEGRKGKRMMKRFDTKHEALQWERRLKGLVSDGVRPDMTVTELAGRFMLHKVKDRKAPRTESDYGSILDLHILPRLGERRVRELKHQDIENWYASTLTAIRDRTGKPGISTANKAATLLFGLLKYAVTLELLDKNPVEGLERISWKPEEKRCYDLVELRRLLDASRQPYRAMFSVGAMAGLMPSEWLALTWADVDLEHAVLKVSHGMTKTREGKYERGITKTPYRVRDLPMPPALVAELQAHWEWCRAECSDRCRPTDLIFATKSGRPMSKDNIRRDGWWPAVKRAELPATQMNSLRHSYATIISTAVPEAVFERLAGHARGSTVGRAFYVHQTALGARDMVDAAFGSGCVNQRVNPRGNQED